MPEVIGAFVGADIHQDLPDGGADGFDGSRAGFSQMVFEFGEQLLDRVQVGGVFWKKDEMCAGVADCRAYGFAFVAAEIVHDDNVARAESRNENRFDIEQKAFPIDGTVDEPRRIHAIVAQRCQESHRVPVAVRRFGFEAFSYQAPAAQWRHIGLGPGLIDKNEPRRINACLMNCPLGAPSSYVGTILFFGQKCFF